MLSMISPSKTYFKPLNKTQVRLDKVVKSVTDSVSFQRNLDSPQKQSELFSKTGFIGFNQPILDGFVYKSHLSSDGSRIYKAQEDILVSMKELEPYINKFEKELIKFEKETPQASCEDRIAFSLDYVYDLCEKNKSPFAVKSLFLSVMKNRNKPVSLLDIIENGDPVCRHRAPFLKILADKILSKPEHGNIRLALQTGCYQRDDSDDKGGHIWNLAKYSENGVDKNPVVDPMHWKKGDRTTGIAYFDKEKIDIKASKYGIPLRGDIQPDVFDQTYPDTKETKKGMSRRPYSLEKGLADIKNPQRPIDYKEKENRGYVNDYSNQDFSNNDSAKFKAAHSNFENSNLSKLEFYQKIFKNSNFRNTNFSEAKMYHSAFVDSDCRGANFEKAYFSEPHFVSGSDFSNAIFNNAEFTDLDTSMAYFPYAQFKQCTFKYSKIDSSNFEYSDFSGSELEIKAESSSFKGANFPNVEMFCAEFKKCNFNDANFSNADLTFSDIDFSSNVFDGADFTGAQLTDEQKEQLKKFDCKGLD